MLLSSKTFLKRVRCGRYRFGSWIQPPLTLSEPRSCNCHWGKADDRNCNYGQPKMTDVESGKNVFCRLNCFYNIF